MHVQFFLFLSTVHSLAITILPGLELLKSGAPGGTRTPGSGIRNPVLYPAELQALLETPADRGIILKSAQDVKRKVALPYLWFSREVNKKRIGFRIIIRFHFLYHMSGKASCIFSSFPEDPEADWALNIPNQKSESQYLMNRIAKNLKLRRLINISQ